MTLKRTIAIIFIASETCLSCSEPGVPGNPANASPYPESGDVFVQGRELNSVESIIQYI
jgi:hypothetical protein